MKLIAHIHEQTPKRNYDNWELPTKIHHSYSIPLTTKMIYLFGATDGKVRLICNGIEIYNARVSDMQTVQNNPSYVSLEIPPMCQKNSISFNVQVETAKEFLLYTLG